MYNKDNRIILTLDAGGTNFVFAAIRGGMPLLSPFRLPANTNNLDECLHIMMKGFDIIISQLNELGECPVAISFAFPGPAEYKKGIIGGNLPNFPAFRQGVALGPFLRYHYKMPVFIENDGNLFAYGESQFGSLVMINKYLEDIGISKRYNNLIGITLGTGFGSGIVVNGQLLNGDNGCGGDIWLMRNKENPKWIAEESASKRAVKRYYKFFSNTTEESLTPKDIYNIAEGLQDGDKFAAIKSFQKVGECVGFSLASVLNIIDGIIVIGGGLIGAKKYILPSLIHELRSSISIGSGRDIPCVQQNVYNWNDESDRKLFVSLSESQVTIPGTNIKVTYDNNKRTVVVCSNTDTSISIMQGAYAWALSQMDSI